MTVIMGYNVLDFMNKAVFLLSVMDKPTASVRNKLRGMAIPESSASFLLQFTGEKTYNKGFYPFRFIWPVHHVLRNILPSGCASHVLPGSTSLASRMSHRALCRHVSTLPASHGSGSGSP